MLFNRYKIWNILWLRYILNTAFSIALTALIIAFAISSITLLLKYFDKLHDKSFKEKYESLYAEIDCTKKLALLSSGLYMLRRIILAIAMIFLQNYFVLQI